MTAPPILWYKDKRKFKLGDVCRYRIRFTNRDHKRTHIYLRVKNVEKTGLRAFHLVNGPFILYCHVIPCNYDPHVRFEPDFPDTNNEVCFRNTIKPGQTFNVRLCLNKNSLLCTNDDGSATYAWSCDVMCQIVLNRRAALSFVVMVGEDLPEMRRVSRSALTNLSKGDFTPLPRDMDENSPDWGQVVYDGLDVACADTDDLWSKEPRVSGKPVHLVVVTHGIFSNLTADMLFLRDMLSSLQSDNYLVQGYRGNAGRTEKGVHRLGVGVSNYVTNLLSELKENGHEVARLSFVGHSLGGPVQLYALKHILMVHGKDYFRNQGIELMHFVCLASPMLGVLSEMSLWISWFLDLGTLGKTGRDLTLSKKFPNLKRHAETKLGMVRPILESLPDEPVQSALASFESRVVYANAVNDGIVPLRTSALLYLDWEALGDVRDLKDHSKQMGDGDEENGKEESAEYEAGDKESGDKESVDQEGELKEKEVSENVSGNMAKRSSVTQIRGEKPGEQPETEKNKSGNDVGQIPEDSELDLQEKYSTFLSRIFNMDGQSPTHKRGKRPKRIKKRIKRYAKISAKSRDPHNAGRSENDEDIEKNTDLDQTEEKTNPDHPERTHTDTGEDEVNTLNIPPKASAVESAINSLICPIPSNDYIDDPDSRTPVIFHDKIYQFDSVPREESHTGTVSKFFKYYDWRMDKQVKIARKYHNPDLSWRKVLVYLPPDAHNNIVVRRRFANGYGWGVIEHLRQEIFGGERLAAKF